MSKKKINNAAPLNDIKPDDIIIRLKTADDNFQDVAKVYAESWQYAYKDILPDEYLKNLTCGKWTNTVNNPDFTHILALDGDKIIGVTRFAKRGLTTAEKSFRFIYCRVTSAKA